MLSRTARVLSRQSLPRPARLFSTPTAQTRAPALATATAHASPDYPSFLAQPTSEPALQPRNLDLPTELSHFLQRPTAYTILPAPLPSDRSSPTNDLYYADTVTQDLLSVMDACLHNLYDVPRARDIFDRLRERHRSHILSTPIYNAFIEAYIALAHSQQGPVPVLIQYACDLYQVLESEAEQCKPNATTYALMLLLHHRFGPYSSNTIETHLTPDPRTLLACIVKRDIPVASVVSDRTLDSSEDAIKIIKHLSIAAVELKNEEIISELGQAEVLGTHKPDVLDDVPEVRPVTKQVEKEDEEGVMETVVPFNINNLRQHLAQVVTARRVLADDIIARQEHLEKSAYDVAAEQLQHQSEVLADLGLGDAAPRDSDLREWMWAWHKKLKDRLTAEIRNIRAAEAKSKRKPNDVQLSPYLSLLDANRLSLLTILEVMRLQGSGGVHDGMKTTRALLSIGKAVELEYKGQVCRANKIYVPAAPKLGNAGYFSSLGYSSLQQRRVAAAKVMSDGEAWTADWTQYVRSKVGGILVECLMDVAEVTRWGKDKHGMLVSEVQPAFYHTYEYIRGQKLGVIRFNPVVSERLARDKVNIAIHPRHLPMLIKPKPWLDYKTGGYLLSQSSAMRFKDSVEQQSYLKVASLKGNCELVFAGLDVLGSTPWQINRDVFNVVLEVWNAGYRVGKLPPAEYDQPEPVMPPEAETDIKAKSVYQQRMKAYLNAKANNHSDRCNVNYKIEIARTFLGDTIYFPHNLDFRGRAYPIPPHLSHIGDDLSRGLLKFADARPLGERGLRWLKIHLANLYGYDKASFDERVEWVHSRLEDIHDSAENPLAGKRWWLGADDPWQCLATCMELRDALKLEDPTAFESSLPIHQDGTCNGLQHYAALGGDDRGAQQVNLAATDRPSDVYTHVGTMVEAALEQDAKKGDQWAILLRGKIQRKIVKQTVMTTVYGVTFVGAREQIEKQLKDKKIVNEEDSWAAASYLATKVIQSIGDLFSGATSIQNWFAACARIIAKSIPKERLPEAMAESKQRIKKQRTKLFTVSDTRLKKEQMTSVVWTTLLGLPIVQPYRKIHRKQVATSLQTIFISDPNSPAEVNSMKQASAFPPNFIHSLDATHMILTALECRTQDLTFASVHDSYWTHASSIDKMSEIIRDTFIALHSSDVLKKLDAEFRERYKDYKVPLVSLKNSSILKGLHALGSRIVVTSEQAKKLDGLKELLVVSDTTETTDIDESEVENVEHLCDEFNAQVGEQAEEDGVAAEDQEDMKIKHSEMRKLMGKFVNLVDLIPPLPEKGSFRVEQIKKSQYFFSSVENCYRCKALLTYLLTTPLTDNHPPLPPRSPAPSKNNIRRFPPHMLTPSLGA
ncbi:hypothetical protein C0992_010594 [Termitomyces sp. T32_za158]|nr:hypothetical protein C0992_010594 [Termitomyces sp. T32_za158]